MDVEIPGSFQEQNSSMELSTPIKKIKNLRLDSPLGSSQIYPKLDGICSPSHIMDSMVDRGYSQRLTNTVLNELNIRANEISKLIKSPGNQGQESSENTTSRRNKRYSGIHRTRFNNMESISNHYSAIRYNSGSESQNSSQTSNHQVSDTLLHRTENHIEKQVLENDTGKRDASVDISSMTKRRKTLNGPEEVLNVEPVVMISSSQPLSSPIKKLSPSKKSFNLNKILNDGEDNNNFLKPVAPSKKLRASSLELAGVKSPTKGTKTDNKGNTSPQLTKKPSTPQLRKQNSISQLQKKTSIPQLQKKTSIPQLQKKTSIPQLQKKTSIPQLHNNNNNNSTHHLQKKPSISQLQKKSSIPQLQKKPSIPQLQKKSSVSNLQNKHSNSQISNKKSTLGFSNAEYYLNSKPFHFLSTQPMDVDDDNQNIFRQPTRRQLSSHFSSKSNQVLPSLGSSKSVSNFSSACPESSRQISHSTSQKFSNVTIPEPFSLYNKPTISSSQKSLNKFQKFKEKFH